MKERYDARYENDTTPSSEIAKRFREFIDDDDHDASLALISYRGGEEEFQLGRKYCLSDDPGDRAMGADILAQLGWGDQTFRDESIELLIPLLADSDDLVVRCAAVALGHRSAEAAIPHLVALAKHPCAKVRGGVVSGLLGQEDERAIDALIGLSKDECFDVRNWAVFGLGTQIEADSEAIRDALRASLSDADLEIRGEALVGLAKRKDPAIVSLLISEWEHDTVSMLSLEAATEVGDPRLMPHLRSIEDCLDLDDDPHFAGILEEAIKSCLGGEGSSNTPLAGALAKDE